MCDRISLVIGIFIHVTHIKWLSIAENNGMWMLHGFQHFQKHVYIDQSKIYNIQ